MLSLDTWACGPSSHSIGKASSAVLACHQVSATTETALSPTGRTCLTPGMALMAAASKLFTLPPKTGQSLTRGVQHPRQLEIHAVDLLAVGLVGRVQPRQSLAGNGPVLRILQRDVLGGVKLGSCGGDFAVADGPAGGLVRDHAVLGAAFGCRHLPPIRRGLDQHHAGGSPALADIVVGFADAAAAAGRKIPPDAVAGDVLTRCRIFRGDLGPVAAKLLRDELRETGQRALPHLRAGDADHHLVVRVNDHPGVDLGQSRPAVRAPEWKSRRRRRRMLRPSPQGCGGGRGAVRRVASRRSCSLLLNRDRAGRWRRRRGSPP